MIKGMSMAKGGSKLPLILAAVLGLVAAGLAVVYLSGAKDEGGTTISGGGGGDTPVVVANQNIGAGVKIGPEMVTVKNVPAEDAIAGYFGSTEGLIGKVTRVAIVANEQLAESKVIGSDLLSSFGANVPLSLLLEPGQRGVSVLVSTQVGAGGNIRPGDFVDVILIVKTSQQETESQTGGGSDQYAATVVQNVKVLAVDQERTNPDPSSSTNPDEAKEENEAATTVTLAVTPIQGEVLTMSEECGRVHDGRLAIALRGPGDTSKLSFRPEWPNDGPPPVCSEVLGIAALGE